MDALRHLLIQIVFHNVQLRVENLGRLTIYL